MASLDITQDRHPIPLRDHGRLDIVVTRGRYISPPNHTALFTGQQPINGYTKRRRQIIEIAPLWLVLP
ncbi:hypothetical protein D3C79_780210 [compost metagenome]